VATSTQRASAGWQRASEWRAPAAATAIAIALHAALFAAWPLAEHSPARDSARPTLQIRHIVRGAATAPAALAPTPAATAQRSARPTDTAAAAAHAPDATPPAQLATREVDPVNATPAPAVSETAADRGGRPVPTYATRPPPAALLAFELSRGGGSAASAELAWRPQADGYTLTLTASVLGRTLMRSESSGRFDAAGLAPERYVDRRRRESRAVNFEREQGRIVYSGPGIEHPLHAGAQDRLSLLVQLAAIVGADPAAFGLGSEISLFVASPRGDSEVWTFGVAGIEPVEVPAGRVEGAWRLLREPRRPYDTRAEIWLDPARSFLPLRVKFSPGQGGEGTEFVLRRLQLQ
jgi:hypothetical protein